MIKQIASLLTAVSLMMPLSLPIAYADEIAAQSDTPTVTVVGKRITGDDKYFEISLEVNGDYEDFSSVGVVLKYDPNIIVPAASWDDDAEQADMTNSTSWATRRALPTLGKDTWTSHTALTYIDNDENSPSGYLYLGAEYPGTLPNDSVNSENSDTTDGEAAATGTPVAAEPTVEPTVAPTVDPSDPYNNPVVVARFMYASDTAKKYIEDNWTEDWDKDWTKNTILTIADDEISEASPAQFGFTIYKADFTMKGFQNDYTKTILDQNEQASKDDIEIVTCEGKSAKSGGLSLNDIFVIMFYDWDDSLLGTLTSGVGVDATESVNDYVKEAFIHPDLQKNTEYSSLARIDNYRGEYPSAGPNATDPTTPGGTGAVDNGEDYPLTNKLDYCFAGRTLYTLEDGTAMPYAGGWTRVTASTMEDTWTALSNDAKDSSGNAYVSEQSFGKMPELDPDTGLPVDSTEVIPNMVSYDFANVQDSDVTGGTLSVKAVYIPGDMLNSGANVGDSLYVTTGDLDYSLLSSLKGEETVFGVSLQYRRINKDGYGTTKAHIPKVRMDMTQDNAAQSTAVTVDVDNGEVIDVELSPSYNVATVDYQLVDTYDANIITGAQYSEQNEKSIKNIDGLTGGFVYAAMWPELLQDIYDITYNKTTAFLTAEELNMLQLKNATNQKEFSTTAHVTAAKTYLKKYIGFAIADGQDWHTLTYYQVQYAICGKASTAAKYKNAQEAEEYCKATYSWCQN